jgi:hypothetical protein
MLIFVVGASFWKHLNSTSRAKTSIFVIFILPLHPLVVIALRLHPNWLQSIELDKQRAHHLINVSK